MIVNIMIEQIQNTRIKGIKMENKIIEKPVFDLILKGNLEIQFDENNATITEIDISAKNLEELTHKLMDKITRVGLSKLNEILQLLVKKQGEARLKI